MFKVYFLIYLLAHMLGDYYFQNEQMADLKNTKITKLLQHNCIYFFACIIVIIPIFSVEKLMASVVVAVMHAIVDFGKYLYIKRQFAELEASSSTIYIVDQVIHIICITLVAYFMTVNRVFINTSPMFIDFLDAIELREMEVLSIICMVLFILKPANITVKQLLSKYKPDECIKFTKKEDKNTGEFIGILERLIIYILLLMNQFSAIGLVLTAKSVARYNKIAEDKAFAEYYLLGTLLSTVLVIVMFKLIY